MVDVEAFRNWLRSLVTKVPPAIEARLTATDVRRGILSGDRQDVTAPDESGKRIAVKGSALRTFQMFSGANDRPVLTESGAECILLSNLARSIPVRDGRQMLVFMADEESRGGRDAEGKRKPRNGDKLAETLRAYGATRREEKDAPAADRVDGWNWPKSEAEAFPLPEYVNAGSASRVTSEPVKVKMTRGEHVAECNVQIPYDRARDEKMTRAINKLYPMFLLAQDGGWTFAVTGTRDDQTLYTRLVQGVVDRYQKAQPQAKKDAA